MDTEICKQTTSKVLLVEGSNDCHVVLALCQAHGVPKNFGVYECGSDESVIKRLNALVFRKCYMREGMEYGNKVSGYIK